MDSEAIRIITPDGVEVWTSGDSYHRIDGPAISYPSGGRYWFVNNKKHRTDGPAVIFKDGTCEWFLNGIHITDPNVISIMDGNEDNLIFLKLKYGF